MVDGESEIDDANFFLSPIGNVDAKAELDATIEAFFTQDRYDDNSSGCRYPARKAWLKEKLNIDNFPSLNCTKYEKPLKRLDPKSATLVFPSAHINSPASMFGHTFLRINSSYESKLLSYAVNYAADVDPDSTNGIIFAIKGLFGGYFGSYSLLPYYEKLKEYRDTEQRDIWEYDLNFTEDEVRRMVDHIWELNGAHSYYYFFTENCSYNMLWLMEVARPSIHLREHFRYQVAPLETVHVSQYENIIAKKSYRASKRSVLLRYEDLIYDEHIDLVAQLIDGEIDIGYITNNNNINAAQKKYILEAAVEFLEYSFSKNDMDKDKYLELFHNLSKTRASLGKGDVLVVEPPFNPLESHRSITSTLEFGYREQKAIGVIGIRPVYHDLEDSNYGFLRGTQIEFLNFQLLYSEDKADVEKATILSISSIAQRSNFFDSFSWRTNIGWDREYLDAKAHFMATVGFGFSWGNKWAYTYFMVDPLVYADEKAVSALGGSIGLVIDGNPYMSTNIEATHRTYDTGTQQQLLHVAQSFRLSQNFQLKFSYDYIEMEDVTKDIMRGEETYKATLNYYY